MKDPKKIGLGPIVQAVQKHHWDDVVLLCDYPEQRGEDFAQWLYSMCQIEKISLHKKKLSSPTNFNEIYQSALEVLTAIKKEYQQSVNITFHLSPGTPAMAAVWILLSKTKFPSTLIESSREYGVKTVSIPFDISVDFIPEQLQNSDNKLVRLAAGLPADAPAFKDIIHRSEVMKRVIIKSRLAAARSIPILIEGESGTGKELLARAIHTESPRASNPFVTINCGAIPSELIESELFGHEKGAFTGADTVRTGYFEAADSGTLFLDEIGELPKEMQVKLLRVLQEGEVKRVGATTVRKIDVRIVAATNKDLLQEVSAGSFREDLFYRLAVAVLKVPSLRERAGDISLLVDKFMEKINEENLELPGSIRKNISASARNVLLQHPWPGNIRELINTLTRATVWSAGDTIQKEDMQESLLPVPCLNSGADTILNKPIEQGVDLPAIMKTVATHYLQKGMNKTDGNKTKSAGLLGLSSYQTLTNWLKKYGLE